MARTNSDDLLMDDDLAAAFLGGEEEVATPKASRKRLRQNQSANQLKMSGKLPTTFLDSLLWMSMKPPTN